MELRDFLIHIRATVQMALRQIDRNQEEYLIVVDDKYLLRGVLSLRDIGRAMSNCIDAEAILEAPVQDYCRNECACAQQGISCIDIIQIFKERDIEVLPVVDKDGRVVDVLTKETMLHALLSNASADLACGLTGIDESCAKGRIFERPWGFYAVLVLNGFFQLKVIVVEPMQSFSLQKHLKREEHWIVVNGQGHAQIGDSIFAVQGGQYLFIPKGSIHRMKNTSKRERLFLVEVQRGEYFGEDDIMRYDDAYGRE